MFILQTQKLRFYVLTPLCEMETFRSPDASVVSVGTRGLDAGPACYQRRPLGCSRRAGFPLSSTPVVRPSLKERARCSLMVPALTLWESKPVKDSKFKKRESLHTCQFNFSGLF